MNKENAIRIEKRKRTDSNSYRTHYIFKCIKEDCNNEVSIRSGYLNESTGMCYIHRSILRRIRPFEKLYNTLKLKANNGIQVDLTYEEYLRFTKIPNCHYCYDLINWTEYSKGYNYNIDRKDSYKGYSLDNCVVCCGICNFTKSNRFTYNEFVKIGNVIKDIKIERKKMK